VSVCGRVESALGRGTIGRGTWTGGVVVVVLLESAVTRRAAGNVAAGDDGVVLVALVPACWNSTGCRNEVATGTPRRLAGAKRSRVDPANAAESSAG
jgi:hypothetical protein